MRQANELATYWRQAVADACAACSPALFRIARGIVRDATVAEDACQTAFLRACECRQEIADLDRLEPWLTRVVVNECMRWLRRRKVENQAQHAHRLAFRAGARESCTPPVAGSSSQDESLEQRLAVELSQLPDATRAVLALRVLGDLSGNETAALLQCSPAEVSRRLYAGMETLRLRLADLVAGGR